MSSFRTALDAAGAEIRGLVWTCYNNKCSTATLSSSGPLSSFLPMEKTHQGRVVDERNAKVTTLLTVQDEHALVSEDATIDDTTLAALGYKQEFNRYKKSRRKIMPYQRWELTNLVQRLLNLEFVWCVFLGSRTPSFDRIYAILQSWILWRGRRSMGLANRSPYDTSYGFQYGRALFEYAYGRWVGTYVPR